MAELLGVIASGMSVVSLAIQIADSIEKLKDLYSALQSAPEELRLAIDDVETLSLILENIDSSMQQQLFLDPRTKILLLRCYRLCQNSGIALRNLVTGLEESFERSKRRGSFKVVLKQENLVMIWKRLESAKATLLLANQGYNTAIQNRNWESHERDMDDIRDTMLQVRRGFLDAANSARRRADIDGEGKLGVGAEFSESHSEPSIQPLSRHPFK